MNRYFYCYIPTSIKKPITLGLILTLILTGVTIIEISAQETYKVAQGNTLYSIAMMHNVTVNELKTWNNLPTERIYTGQLLIVSNPIKHGQESPAYSPGQQDRKSEAEKIDPLINPYSLHISELEIKYDQYLELILSRFFTPNSFKVDVRFDLQKAGMPVARKAKQLPISDVVLPGVPFIPEELIRRQQQQTNVFFPDDFNAPFFEINRLSITVYADVSYSNEDYQFMKEMLRLASKLNNNRGDTIIISPIIFPQLFDSDNSDEKVELHKKSRVEIGLVSQTFYFVIFATLAVIVLLFFVVILLRKRL